MRGWILAGVVLCACDDVRVRHDAGLYERPPLGQPDARPIEIPETAPEVLITPGSIDWLQDVVVGRQWWHRITVANIGRETLLLRGLGIDGPGFAIRIDGIWLEDQPGLVDDPDQDGVPGLVQGGFFEAKIYFKPEAGGEHDATLWMRTNDPRGPRHEVPISALALDTAPCAPMGPDPLDFGEVALEIDRRRDAVVTNCSEGPLHILSVEADGPFDVRAEVTNALPIRIRAPADIFDQPSRALAVHFEPDELGPARGALHVLTDDPDIPMRSIALGGTGVPNQCPTAIIEPARVTLAPGQVFTFSGERSSDPEGQSLTRVWALETPAGSGAALRRRANALLQFEAPGPRSLRTSFAPDLLGRYVVQLDVQDEAGNLTSVCRSPARVPVQVEPPSQGLSVELTWDMERPGQNFTGTDLDLHLLREGAEWFSRDSDVWAANPNPSFDLEEEAQPRMGVTTNGGGPETIYFGEPEVGVTYRLAVHYFRQHTPGTDFDHGASTATVRIYARGRVVWTSQPRRMEGVNGFWIPAEFTWPGPDVRVVDRYFPVRP